MTHEQMIDFLVERDIQNIMQDAADGDYSYLDAILRGEGFTQYNWLKPEEVAKEYYIATEEA